jgi:hypothetical protein
LLKINIVAHVLCALAADLFWLKKPYEAHEPLRVDVDWTYTMVALWSMKLDLNDHDNVTCLTTFYGVEDVVFEHLLPDKVLQLKQNCHQALLMSNKHTMAPMKLRSSS